MIITAANTVSRASVAVSSPPGDHQRHDQRDLDDRHRDREHERAERLPHPVRDDLGVVDRGEHGAGEEHADDGEDRPGGLLPHVAASTSTASTGTTRVHLMR